MKFSAVERGELAKAWIAVSFAFAVLLSGGLDGLLSGRFLVFFIAAAVTVGVGFLLHELAHKIVAQLYGCWAEFRSDNRMLFFMIVVSFFGFVFAAPGAVVIHGLLDREKSGRISVAGPLMNVLLAGVFLGLAQITSGMIGALFSYGFTINAWLGLFNMLPFFGFDGVKVLEWNKVVYSIVLVVAGLLSFVGWIA